ncbi:tRNA pseudouridine(55) synthase TruB [Candidatus Nomurabacteria bacterium]|nr:tRNA pseudouridine(55) synthase TruB [Candidatus Nomurabacteria bacterium]
MHGFLLIDKPENWTSHDVVAYLRGALKIKKIGHAGTLDPFATGLLVVAIAREATKRLDEFKGMPKTYVTTLQFGATTDTYDKTGEITRTARDFTLDKVQLTKTLESFIGKQLQIPPMYSAKKVQGKKLYELARKGIEIERKPSEIEIFDIKLLQTTDTTATIEVSCSTGTYIRTLCQDIGQKLGLGAYCESLRRIKIGNFSVDKAIHPKEISKDNIERSILTNV